MPVSGAVVRDSQRSQQRNPMMKRPQKSSPTRSLRSAIWAAFLAVSAVLPCGSASPGLNRAEQDGNDTDLMRHSVPAGLKPVEQEAWLAMARRQNPEAVADNTWTPTGNLAAARARHTATLLANGKVLVAGGRNRSGPSSSAELYDPASGLWTSTGSLPTTRRVSHSDAAPQWEGPGRRRICSNGAYASSAELYDPATGLVEYHRQPRHRTLRSHGDIAAQWQSACRRRIQ